MKRNQEKNQKDDDDSSDHKNLYQNNNESKPLSSRRLLDKASRELTKSLIDDLPILMYGSGDVYPFSSTTTITSSSSSRHIPTSTYELQTDINTTSLLAELTSSFVYDLVNAAIDSHDIFTDGKSGGGGGIIPNFSHTREGGHGYGNHDNENDTTNGNKTNKRQRESLHHNRNGNNHERNSWKGALGLDCKSSEIRSTYMSSTTTINEKSFLLPICHDSEMYNRSREILSFHDNALGALFDPVVQQCLKDEEEASGVIGIGGVVHGGSNSGEEERKRRRKDNNNNNDGIPMVHYWPEGVDDILQM